MNSSLVSIIIPCYNCGEVVSRAIESVFRQTLPNWELILVNNNSTDDTQIVLNRFYEAYPYCITCVVEVKPGASAARNAGLKQAVGEWVQFLDANDELMPEKISRQLRLARRGSFDVISGAYLSNRTTGDSVVENLAVPKMGSVWKALISSKLGITSGNLWKKDILMNVYGWDESLCSSQEYDLMFRLLTVNARLGFDLSPQTIVHKPDAPGFGTERAKQLEKMMNDSIYLRLRIKNYLISEGLFSHEMSVFFDACLYKFLIGQKHLVPEYVSRRLKELSLHVSFKERFSLETGMMLKQLLRRNS